MAFEKLKTEIGILLTEMQNEPEDAHELSLLIHGKLQELKAFGMPLPADLVALDEALAAGADAPDEPDTNDTQRSDDKPA